MRSDEEGGSMWGKVLRNLMDMRMQVQVNGEEDPLPPGKTFKERLDAIRKETDKQKRSALIEVTRKQLSPEYTPLRFRNGALDIGKIEIGPDGKTTTMRNVFMCEAMDVMSILPTRIGELEDKTVLEFRTWIGGDAVARFARMCRNFVEKEEIPGMFFIAPDPGMIRNRTTAFWSKKAVIVLCTNDPRGAAGNHWLAIKMIPHDRSMEYFDSFGRATPEVVWGLLENALQRAYESDVWQGEIVETQRWQEHWHAEQKRGLQEDAAYAQFVHDDLKMWKRNIRPSDNEVYQHDGFQCGAWAMYRAECWMLNWPMAKLDAKHIELYRQRLMFDILVGRLMITDEYTTREKNFFALKSKDIYVRHIVSIYDKTEVV